jgi:hypothetical protein
MRQTKILYPQSNPRKDFIEELCENTDFNKAVIDLRYKWKIDVAKEIYLSEDKGGYHYSKQKKLSNDKKLIAEINRLQKRFKLGEEWFSFIEEYIFLDTFVYYKASSLFIEKRTGRDVDKITGKPAYYLRIFPETTKEDLSKSWSEINSFINKTKIKSKRQKSSINFNRDKKIYILAKSGYRLEDIQRYFKDKYKKIISFDTIKMSDSRYRKRVGIKKGNKLGYIKKGSRQISHQQYTLDVNFPDFE